MAKFGNYLFWLISIINGLVVIISSNNLCPENCQCDLYENLNRANCSNSKIFNAAAIDIPVIVQIFDLSGNSITTLDNQCFEKLVNVINLMIQKNSIHTIYLEAFSNLKKLKYLDLSINRLEYFDERILENNEELLELNLSGNKFMSLTNKPLILSNSLEILYLQNSQITHIYGQTFEWTPHLKKIDISGNIMITLTVMPFNKLRKLQNINLNNNRWICDKNFVNVVKLLHRRHTKIELNSCTIEIDDNQQEPKMFERMIMSPTTKTILHATHLLESTITTSPPSTLTTPKQQNSSDRSSTPAPRSIYDLGWHQITSSDINNDYNNSECIHKETATVCALYHDCMKNITDIMTETNHNRYHNNVEQKFSPTNFCDLLNDTKLVFLMGVTFGAAIVFIFMSCAICIAKCPCWSSHKRQTFERNRSVPTDDFLYVRSPPPPPPATSSVPLRTSSRRQNNRRINNRPIQRHDTRINHSSLSSTRYENDVSRNSDFATFLARIFERPSRHRYYRTINQNTAYMIRRLSRSNLFNNRLSRHFSQETAANHNNQPSNDENQLNINQTQEQEQEQYQQFIDEDVDDDVAVVGNDEATNLLHHHHYNDDINHEISSIRPETPPPSYTEITMTKC